MDDHNTLLFNLYTNVRFHGLAPDRNGVSVTASVDTPPGQARSPNSRIRTRFWENMGSKRLLTGGLVALIWQRDDGAHVHLGIVSSSLRDHTESARQDSQRISIRVSFFDPAVELRILQELQLAVKDRRGFGILVEATVMFESIRPFLDALRVEPTSIPFAQYLALKAPGQLSSTHVEPPAYAKRPDFSFELAALCRPGAEIPSLKLSVCDPASVENARTILRTESCLDPSQADALVNALTNEVALIQG